MKNKMNGHQITRNLYGPPQRKREQELHSERIVGIENEITELRQEQQFSLEDVNVMPKDKE